MEGKNYECKGCGKIEQRENLMRFLSGEKCPECLGISFQTLQMVYDLIVEAEGYRSEVYKDTLGYETIAYGHLLLPHQKGVLSKVTESEGLELLKMDIGKAIKEFKEYWVGVELCDARQAVLIDMTYNLGIVRWPKLTKALKQGDYKKAAVQIMDSKYAEQVGLRAKRNACIMRDGVMFQIITQNWENNVQM